MNASGNQEKKTHRFALIFLDLKETVKLQKSQ